MSAVEAVDTVVVGSGFGGAPVAYRLAAADQHVCLLERGRPYPPGSFPRSPAAVARNFWDPSEGLYGMFNPWSFRHIEAVVSSGLGGGSLIYANVLLRKDERWFQESEPSGWQWPVSRAELDPYYENAEMMLGANPYPYARQPYASTPKTEAMKVAFERLRDTVPEEISRELPNLAISFTPAEQNTALGVPIPEPDGPNLHHQPRYTCRLVGECDIGCNFGAKNSLDYTYLSAAQRAGAEIRTLCEVRKLTPDGDGYRVSYDHHEPDPDRPVAARRERRELRARRVVLAAGSLGTTYLLLRNRSAFPAISDALGTRFSGNGDFLAFARNCRHTTDGGTRVRAIEPSRGPVITTFIRMPDALDGADQGAAAGGRGFYIEDAGWPEFANWLVEVFDTPGILWRALSSARSARRHYLEGDPVSAVGAELSQLFGDAALTNASLGLLGMGRDIPDGRLRLRGHSRLEVDWNECSSGAYFAHMRTTMERIAEVLGGDYVENPTRRIVRRLITVHPLGGCPMGHSREDGVVDCCGRVFGQDNLFITDGSVMPGPVGANPALTIAAFAERAAESMLKQDEHG